MLSLAAPSLIEIDSASRAIAVSAKNASNAARAARESTAELYAERSGEREQGSIERDTADASRDLRNWHGHDVVSVQRDDAPGSPFGKRRNRRSSKCGCQQTIEGRRRAAALQVSENDCPALLARRNLELGGNVLANAAQTSALPLDLATLVRR